VEGINDLFLLFEPFLTIDNHSKNIVCESEIESEINVIQYNDNPNKCYDLLSPVIREHLMGRDIDMDMFFNNNHELCYKIYGSPSVIILHKDFRDLLIKVNESS
jgi:hypothetical protein